MGRTACLGVLSGLLALGALGSAAWAEPDGPDAVESCRAELDALCPGLAPRSPEQRRCVRENASKLSEECAALAYRMRHAETAGVEVLRGVCGREIDEYCDEVRRGSGRLLRCLGSLEQEKCSEGCRDYLDLLTAVRERRRAGDAAE